MEAGSPMMKRFTGKGHIMTTTSGDSRTPKRFSEMTGFEKVRFACKAFVFFVSGGFVYPTLWID